MKAVAYARFSTDRQREESITAQLRAISEWAMKNNVIVVREYLDEGKSATSDDRPAFQQMIGELGLVKPKLVLVHKLDRFARDRFDAAFYRREIQKAGARLLAVDQPMDDSPESAFLEGILEAQAEFYSRNLAREVMKGMKENAFKAKFNGGRVPLGFDIAPDGSYIINEEEAATIRIIFSMKLAGTSLLSIIEELNRQGRKTKGGQPFGKNSIDSVLRNERYSGTYIFNQTPKKVAGKRNNRVKNPDEKVIRVEGAVPAIISKEEWDAVQLIMDSNKYGPREKGETLFILTGILKCGECGAAMVGNTITKRVDGKAKKYHYYECNKAKRAGGCSHKKRYPQEKLEASMLKFIEDEIINPVNVNKIVDRLWNMVRQVNEASDKQSFEVKKRLIKNQKQMDRIVDSIKKGLPFEHMTGYFNELAEEKIRLEGMLSEYHSPFHHITRQHLVNYMNRQKGKMVKNALPETRKNIVATYVKEATILGSITNVLFKLQLGSLDKAGVGEGT